MGGAAGIMGVGIAAGSIGLTDMRQEESVGTSTTSPSAQDLVAVLESLNRALDAGLINQAEYEAARAKALGLS